MLVTARRTFSIIVMVKLFSLLVVATVTAVSINTIVRGITIIAFITAVASAIAVPLAGSYLSKLP